ncbi:barstar family protein [Embleya sp. NPDC050493]|uniref:barstar family protein n=1 Tax=Embleya sp. NPDC050493 TaxID=3363989 RepID=UPI0037A94D2E
MILGEEIWQCESPWFHFAPDTEAHAIPSLPTGSVYCARLDGARMLDSQGVFESFSSELKFPVQFGWNWPAFAEYSRDLSWIPAERYLLLVFRADLLLRDEPEGKRVLSEILNRTVRTFGTSPDQPAKPPGKEIAFNIVFYCAPLSLERTKRDLLM